MLDGNNVLLTKLVHILFYVKDLTFLILSRKDQFFSFLFEIHFLVNLEMIQIWHFKC